VPELPEVETTVRGLEPVLKGQRLTSVEPRRADLRKAIPVDLRQRMTGATVTTLGRRAKYGLIDTDRGDTLVFDPSELLPHDHLLIGTGAGRTVALNDPRRFGFLDLWATDDIANYPPFLSMGPEPLGPDLTAAYLLEALEGRGASIKAMLLDQRIVAGLGNIYVCEALHMAKIAPSRAAGRISLFRLERLVEAIRAVLTAAILAGGSSLRDYVRPDGELGYFSKQWRVYGREGEACECGAAVRRRTEGGRSTFWCAKCQRG